MSRPASEFAASKIACFLGTRYQAVGSQASLFLAHWQARLLPQAATSEADGQVLDDWTAGASNWAQHA